MRAVKNSQGYFLLMVLIILVANLARAQDETLAEIKYKEDYDRLQKIAAITNPSKRADLLVKFYREKPDLEPRLKQYADSLFLTDLDALMKQQNFIAIRGLTERVLQIRPKFGEAYFFHAVALKNDKKIEEAMQSLARCYVIKNPYQKRAKQLLDVTYRDYNKGSMVGLEKIINQANQAMK